MSNKIDERLLTGGLAGGGGVLVLLSPIAPSPLSSFLLACGGATIATLSLLLLSDAGGARSRLVSRFVKFMDRSRYGRLMQRIGSRRISDSVATPWVMLPIVSGVGFGVLFIGIAIARLLR